MHSDAGQLGVTGSFDCHLRDRRRDQQWKSVNRGRCLVRKGGSIAGEQKRRHGFLPTGSGCSDGVGAQPDPAQPTVGN